MSLKLSKTLGDPAAYVCMDDYEDEEIAAAVKQLKELGYDFEYIDEKIIAITLF